MKNFKQLNIIFGWVSFAIAAVTYILTTEPTTSLWDCGEFIASAFKLEVGHPPGAPFFMIMARFASLFTTDVAKVAHMVNIMSALASAFTILFLFWTITHLAKKIMANKGEISLANGIVIIGSGLVGALAYTFSDTFWFSAVEGEVYASSSLFTAIVFWAILKWENVADEKYANRWLILIAYLMGLSIGVHLLNLLAIPAIVFVFYFKKYNVERKGIIIASIVSLVLLTIVMYGIIPGLITVASWFELLFVNTFGLGYNTGVIFYAILLIASLVLGIYFSHLKINKNIAVGCTITAVLLLGIPFMSSSFFLNLLLVSAVVIAIIMIKENVAIINTILIGFAVIVIGYSSFSMIVIRSLANPPMDENDPETVFALLSYLNREQYGDRPLFFGQYYNAPIVDVKKDKPTYSQKDGKYVVTNHKQKYVYDERMTTFFPRMYSNDPSHVDVYKEWANIKGKTVRVGGEEGTLKKPTFGENIKFFVKYQLGFMYGRYFMWNFVGRQNDTQGHGGILKGNWISGIPFIDKGLVGDQSKLPERLKNEKSRNTYYFLPLILGLFGFFFQAQKHRNDFVIVTLLFILTGIAIVVYLNQTPIQPRERDYAYAGSFYAFSIWIGLGVLALYDALSKKSNKIMAAGVTLVCLGLVPGVMASENWDDHDRSGRYTARDLARNYLETCAPNAILFTNGDNDTFPLWYAQEVEGIRTDVRVCNLMLLNTDWYIDQMSRKAYESDALPISFTKDEYIQGTRDVVYLLDKNEGYADIESAIKWIKSDNPKTKLNLQSGDAVDYLPTKNLRLNVDIDQLIKTGTITPDQASEVDTVIEWRLKANHLGKSDLMVLDMLATNNWERPIYYVSSGHEGTLGLDDYFQLEGFAHRLVPIKHKKADMLNVGGVNADVMYNNMINKFTWRGMADPDVYLDHYNHRTYSVIKIRNKFNRLADQLIKEGKKDSALVALDRCMELMPHERTPFDFFVLGTIEKYFSLGEKEKAEKYLRQFYLDTKDLLVYYTSLNAEQQKSVNYEIRLSLQLLSEMAKYAKPYNEELSREIEEVFRNYAMSVMG